MDQLEKRTKLLVRAPWVGAPIQVVLCGLCLVFATPLCCALFPQKASVTFESIEPELQDKAKQLGLDKGNRVYFNKGL